jgi:hypothetical protein
MSVVDATAPAFRAMLKAFGGSVSYTPTGGATVQIVAFVRGIREEDLFVEALQRDSVAVLDAAAFTAATGEATPRRLDRLQTAAGKYTVESWRASPESGPFIFMKLLLRGGQQ